MFRMIWIPLVLALAALPAQAHEDRARTVVGAGLGAAIGSELGGRNEAILGGALGGAVGAAIATEGRYGHHHDYRSVRQYEHWDDGRYGYTKHGRRGPPHCPPGLAKQGRC